MKKFSVILAILLLAVSAINAQKLFICNSYTQKGEPIDALYKAEFDTAKGLYAYALFNYNGVKLKSDILFLYIDKIIDGRQIPFDSRALQTSDVKSWLVYDYEFKESGNYVFYVADSFGKKLASCKVLLNSPVIKINVSTRDPLYYSNCEITFCPIVMSGKPLNKYNALKLDKKSRPVTVYLNNKKPVKTGRLLVVVWKKNDNSFEYDDFVASKRFLVQRDWDDTFFKYTFKQSGEYKFSIYDENEKLIKSAFFTVYN